MKTLLLLLTLSLSLWALPEHHANFSIGGGLKFESSDPSRPDDIQQLRDNLMYSYTLQGHYLKTLNSHFSLGVTFYVYPASTEGEISQGEFSLDPQSFEMEVSEDVYFAGLLLRRFAYGEQEGFFTDIALGWAWMDGSSKTSIEDVTATANASAGSVGLLTGIGGKWGLNDLTFEIKFTSLLTFAKTTEIELEYTGVPESELSSLPQKETAKGDVPMDVLGISIGFGYVF